MKKLTVLLTITLVFAMAGISWAAGSCVQRPENYPDSGERHVIFTCTGDAADGSIPSTAIAGNTQTDSAMTAFIKGYRFYEIEVYPTAGGTAPDAADVFILTTAGLDLLGSEDGGTTAYQGLNLIHATLSRVAFPDAYIPRAGAHAFYHPLITGALQLKVANQATASANYTVILKTYKPTQQ